MKISDIEQALEDYLLAYDTAVNDTLPMIEIDGVTLKNALTAQIKLQLRWETLAKKINKIYDVCEFVVESAYADAVTKELKDSYRNTSISEAREFAKADHQYKAARRIMIEAKVIRDETKGILDTIQSRKYILNNITNCVVASSENHVI
jgi:uncharacterized lipoprotein NlpE involved in copper resistance